MKSYEFLVGNRKVICSSDTLLNAYTQMRSAYKGLSIVCLRVIS